MTTKLIPASNPSPATLPAPTLTINGATYLIADISEAARGQLGNVQMIEGEMQHLQRRMAITQTARDACLGALVAALVGTPSTPAAPALTTAE